MAEAYLFGDAARHRLDERPWTWQGHLETTSNELKQLIAMNDTPDSIELDIRRISNYIKTNQKDWVVVFDKDAERKELTRSFYVRDYKLSIFGNCIVVGLDNTGRLRGLFPDELIFIKQDYKVTSL